MRQQEAAKDVKPTKIDVTYKQGLFLQSDADEILFGGAAGG
jgi:hypothetical protein